MTPFEATLAAVLALPAAAEDKTDPRQPAHLQAIALEVSQLKPPRGIGAKDWRSLVLAVGFAETHMSLRIMDGHCKAFECDRGKARSGWQLQQNRFTSPVWEQLHGLDNLHTQVVTADGMLKRSWYQCNSASVELPFAVQRTIIAFAGRGCTVGTIVPWAGLQLRTGYWLTARRKMG
jgi:hypothetical protein